MSSLTTNTPLRYSPFTSVVSAQFWHSLLIHKLNVLKLDDTPLPIRGYYDPSERYVHFVEEFGAVDPEPMKNERCYLQGTFKLFNTMEEFKTLNKVSERAKRVGLGYV